MLKHACPKKMPALQVIGRMLVCQAEGSRVQTLSGPTLGVLKEQYPVTAHAPNFDFWTGCPEIKRCEESKRTLKNPFASRLAEFNTTLKLLRITDQ